MGRHSSISFVIPAYNCEQTLEESVMSIYQGNFEEGDEVIIVNDASTDGTEDVMEKLKGTFPALRILKHHLNKGTAAAGRNTGIDASINQLIFSLDADNLLVPGSISMLTKALLEQSSDAAAFGEIHYFQTSPQAVTHTWVFKDRITFSDCLSTRVNPLGSGNYLFKKESWKKAGRYFEPSLINQTLDSWTFGIRLLGTGAKFVTLPGTYYLHSYGHESHFMREYRHGNISLAALVAILPFIDQIRRRDVNYIFSERGRKIWFHRLDQHPILLKTTFDLQKEAWIKRAKEFTKKVLHV